MFAEIRHVTHDDKISRDRMTSFVVWYRISIASLIFLIRGFEDASARWQLLLLRLFIGCASDSFLSFLEMGLLHFL